MASRPSGQPGGTQTERDERETRDADPIDLRHDDPASRPVGARRNRARDQERRGHSREAAPYEEAPAEGHLAPDADDSTG